MAPDEDYPSTLVITFPDVPEAIPWAEEGEDATAMALDALVTALGIYLRKRAALPRPSPARGRPVVVVPPLVAAKLALYGAMREQGITNVELARRLGVTENAVRALLKLSRQSHIGHVERALGLLGLQLEVRVSRAA
jgi:antitoxin HicB